MEVGDWGEKNNVMMNVKCIVQTEWSINGGLDYYDAIDSEENWNIGGCLLSHPDPPPLWEKGNLKSKLPWTLPKVTQICGRGWILIIPFPMLFPVPQTRSLLNEACTTITSTKDSLVRMKLSSRFGEVHFNSGSLQLKQEILYLYNL